jgi:hypothetical protein
MEKISSAVKVMTVGRKRIELLLVVTCIALLKKTAAATAQ